MKKNTVFSIAFLFGLFLMSGSVSAQQAQQQDNDEQRKPIAVNNLPEEVSEAIQADYEGFRITEAFMVNKEGQSGAESQNEDMRQGTARTGTVGSAGTEQTGTQRGGTEQTGTQRGTNPEVQAGQQSGAERSEELLSENVDLYYEVKLAKDQETKTVKYNEDGEELDKDKKDDMNDKKDDMQKTEW